MPSFLVESVHHLAVSRQVTGLREGLTACGADVGAVTGMDAHVFRQVAGLREGLTACGADVGAVASMGAHVCREMFICIVWRTEMCLARSPSL